MSQLRNQLAQAVKDHRGYVFRLAYAVVGNHADAEDVAQLSFMQLVRHADQLRKIESLAAWLGRVTINGARKHMRSENNRRKRESVWAKQDIQRKEEFALDPADIDALRIQIAKLPEELRLPLLFHYHEGLKYREIAELLECPEGTVAKRLHTGKEKLRSELQRAGHSMPALIPASFAGMIPQCRPQLAEQLMSGIDSELAALQSGGAVGAVGAGSKFAMFGFFVAALLLGGYFQFREAPTSTNGAEVAQHKDLEMINAAQQDLQISKATEKETQSRGKAEEGNESREALPAAIDSALKDNPKTKKLASSEVAREGDTAAEEEKEELAPKFYGWIRDLDGRGISNAKVSIRFDNSSQILGECRSDVRGYYELEGVLLDQPAEAKEIEVTGGLDWSQHKPAFQGQTMMINDGGRGSWINVLAQKDGYQSVNVTVFVKGKSEVQQDLQLPNAAPVTGRIVDSKGNGIAGAVVKLAVFYSSAATTLGNKTRIEIEASDQSCISGESGNFKLGKLPAGQVLLQVRATGYVVKEALFTAGQGPKDLLLEKGSEMITQLVHRESKQFISGARLSLYQGGQVMAEGLSDTDGKTHFQNLLPGDYELAVVRNALPLKILPVTLSSEYAWNQKVFLDDGYSLSGIIDCKKAGVRGMIRVHLSQLQLDDIASQHVWGRLASFSFERKALDEMLLVGRDGEYEFGGLAKGSYRLAAYATKGKGQIYYPLFNRVVNIGGTSRDINLNVSEFDQNFGTLNISISNEKSQKTNHTWVWVKGVGESPISIFKSIANWSQLSLELPVGNYDVTIGAVGYYCEKYQSRTVMNGRSQEIVTRLRTRKVLDGASLIHADSHADSLAYVQAGTSAYGFLLGLADHYDLNLKLSPRLKNSGILNRMKFTWTQCYKLSEWLEQSLGYFGLRYEIRAKEIWILALSDE